MRGFAGARKPIATDVASFGRLVEACESSGWDVVGRLTLYRRIKRPKLPSKGAKDFTRLLALSASMGWRSGGLTLHRQITVPERSYDWHVLFDIGQESGRIKSSVRLRRLEKPVRHRLLTRAQAARARAVALPPGPGEKPPPRFMRSLREQLLSWGYTPVDYAMYHYLSVDGDFKFEKFLNQPSALADEVERLSSIALPRSRVSIDPREFPGVDLSSGDK